jgi:hypothetical protein
MSSEGRAQELVVHVAAVYSGYVSSNDWDRDRPAAHLFFSLADEAIAAAMTLQMVAREAASKLNFGPRLHVLDKATAELCPKLALRICVSSHRGVPVVPSNDTGRLVRAAINHQEHA